MQSQSLPKLGRQEQNVKLNKLGKGNVNFISTYESLTIDLVVLSGNQDKKNWTCFPELLNST